MNGRNAQRPSSPIVDKQILRKHYTWKRKIFFEKNTIIGSLRKYDEYECTVSENLFFPHSPEWMHRKLHTCLPWESQKRRLSVRCAQARIEWHWVRHTQPLCMITVLGSGWQIWPETACGKLHKKSHSIGGTRGVTFDKKYISYFLEMLTTSLSLHFECSFNLMDQKENTHALFKHRQWQPHWLSHIRPAQWRKSYCITASLLG